MPQIIANVAYWAVGALTTVGFSQAAAVAIVDFGLKLGATALLSSLSSKLFGPKVAGVGLSPLNVMSRSSLEHRKVVYGQAIVSGPVYYNNLSGTSNEYLWYGVALCDGRSEDLVEVWFDGETIPKADISWTAGTGASDGTGTGDVSTATYVGDNSTAGAQIFYYLGDDAQPACGALDTAFSEITSNHRLRGVTHIVVKLLYDEDTSEVWKSGPPNNIKVVLKGRLIYDPRLDTTQIIDPTTSPVTYGSSTQRTTDSTTWTYSDNPALCIADYLTQVMGVATTSIDWPSVADAADDCEVLVVIPPATSPETQEARFTCNGALSLGSTHKDNLDALLSSMAGRLSYSGGVWKVRCSVWEASSVTITEDDLAGDVEVRGSAPKSERFNGVRGFFIDPTRNYESAEFPHVSEATYVTRDNGETILYDLQLPMTNSATEAQRVAYRNLGQGNNQVIAKLKLNAKGSKIAVGDVVTHTISTLWSSKTFRCIEWARNPNGTFDVTLKEDDSTDYDDPLVTAYGTAGTGGVTVPADIVPPPTSLTATQVGAGIELAWTNPSPDLFDYIDIYQSNTNAWGGASLIASVRANTYVVPLLNGEVRYYWIRATREPLLESIREPNSDTSSVTATAPVAGAGADGDDAVTVVYTNNNHSVPVTTAGSETWTGSGGLFYVFEGTTLLTFASNTQSTNFGAISAGEYLIDIAPVSGDTLTEPTMTGQTTTTATLGDWASDLTQVTVYRLTASIKTADATQITIQQDVTLSPSDQGDAGTDGDDAFAVSYTNNSHSVPVTNLGVETWTGSGGLFYAYEGGTVLTLNTNTQTGSYTGLSNGEYNLNITKISGDTLTEPGITGATTTTATIADWASNLTTATVYRITAYIQGATGTQVTLYTDVTLTPGDQGDDGADGADGDPGLPGASTICLFDDADTGISSTSAGKYGLGTSTSVGTLDWSVIIDGSSILYIVCPNLSTGSTYNYTDLHTQIVSGDVVTFYDAEEYPGRWVSFMTTGVGVSISGGYRFPVDYITHFNNGIAETSDMSGTGGYDVHMRWSRAYTDPPAPALGDIDTVTPAGLDTTGPVTASFRVDSDGDYYKDEDGGGYVSQGTWLGSGATNTDFEVMLTNISGTAVTGSSQDTWLVPSSDRTWTLTRSSGTGVTSSQCQVYYRDATTNVVLAIQTVRFICTIE